MASIAAIHRVQFTVTDWNHNGSLKFGTPNVYQFGYCYFLYGGQEGDDTLYPGKLQFVNFINQVFFPDGPDAIAFITSLKPGVQGYATPFYKPSSQALQVAGNIVNPLTGALVNFKP